MIAYSIVVALQAEALRAKLLPARVSVWNSRSWECAGVNRKYEAANAVYKVQVMHRKHERSRCGIGNVW